MTAEIIALASTESVDEAWDDLVRHRRCLLSEGAAPLLDREWVEREARLHARFIELFRRSEPPCDVVAMRGGK